MSKIIEHFLVPLFVIMSILYAFNSLSNDVCLKKVFHHAAGDETYIECGNVALYFSQEPAVQKVESATSNAPMKQSFFVPCRITTGECEAMIQKINGYAGCYNVSIAKTVTPHVGIQIEFSYDPQKIALSYESFDAIGLQKGIVFHLYNKSLIDTLQHKNNQPILRTLQNSKKPCIAIDVGHGGGDSGAIGLDNTVQEKDVCLALGCDVADLLRQKGCSVVLTRETDCDMALDDRTFYVNTHHVDACISIHANYSLSTQASGIETFYIKPTLFKEQFSLLAEDEKRYVAQCMHKRSEQSYSIAFSIQRSLCEDSGQSGVFFKTPVDRHVKSSVAQVLLGAQMPSVLVEVGFLSHPEEVKLLCSAQYQHFLAQRIANGILAVLPS